MLAEGTVNEREQLEVGNDASGCGTLNEAGSGFCAAEPEQRDE